MNDRKLVRWLFLLLLLPIGLAMCSNNNGDQFRYPCQNPANWDKPMCEKPLCDVTRTCPEHVFKGGRDPRIGMPDDKATVQQTPQPAQGSNCGK